MKSIDFMFILNSILFGVGLAMDAFSVSLADGLHEPRMKPRRICLIAGTFGVFQTLMPLAGWFFVRTAEQLFSVLQRFIPWIALLLLLYSILSIVIVIMIVIIWSLCLQLTEKKPPEQAEGGTGAYGIRGSPGRRGGSGGNRPFRASPAGNRDVHRRAFGRLYDFGVQCVRSASGGPDYRRRDVRDLCRGHPDRKTRGSIPFRPRIRFRRLHPDFHRTGNLHQIVFLKNNSGNTGFRLLS